MYCRGIFSSYKCEWGWLGHLFSSRMTICYCCNLFCPQTSNWSSFCLNCRYNHRTKCNACGSNCSSSFRFLVTAVAELLILYGQVSIVENNSFWVVLVFHCDVTYTTKNNGNAVRDMAKWRIRFPPWWSDKELFFGSMVEFFSCALKKWSQFESVARLHLPVRCFHGTQLHSLGSSSSPQVEIWLMKLWLRTFPYQLHPTEW